MWNGTSAFAPVDLPAGLAVVTLTDKPPGSLVVAWPKAGRSPLVRGFVRVAWDGHRE